MRLAPLVRRPAALLAAGVLLATAGSVVVADPALAATTITSATNPVNLTNRTTVVVNGTADGPGEPITVTITDGTTTVPQTNATTLSGQDSSWTVTRDVTTLRDGVLTVNASGPLSGAASRQIVKDTVPPSDPTNLTVTPSPTVNASQQQSVVVSVRADNTANQVKLEVGSLVRFPVNNNGVYTSTFDITTLGEGLQTVRATAYDAAGNADATPPSTTITKDTVAPTFGTYAYGTGTVQTTPNRVNNTFPGAGKKVGVTVGANEASTYVVTITDSLGAKQTFSGPATAATTYGFSFDPYGFADGTLTLSTVPTDAAGNTGNAGTSTLLKDTTTPVVTNVVVTPSPINNAGKSNVVVTGKVQRSAGAATPASEAGTKVAINPSCSVRPADPMNPLDNPQGPTAQSVTMAADGTFTSTAFETQDCRDGSQGVTFNVIPTDPGGNVGATVSTAVDKDVVAPGNPTVTSLANALPANLTAVPFQGVAEAGSTVKVTVTDSGTKAVVVTVPANGSGAFSGTADLTSLADGTITARATATDAAGNTSAVSDPRTANKDTTAFALVATSPTPNSTAGAGTTVQGTFNEPLNLPSSSITLRDGSNAPVSGSTSYADGNRTIVFTPTNPLTTGSYVATITGKESGAGDDPAITTTVPFSVDVTAPAAPTLTSLTNPVNKANQTAVHAVGSAEAGATVTVTLTGTSGTVSKSQVVPAGGGYDITLDATALPDGTLTAVAQAKDSAGNTSANSASRQATKDTVAPTVSGVTATDTTQAAPSTTVTATSNENNAPFTVTLTDRNGKTVSKSGTTSGSGAVSTTVDASTLADGTVTASVVVTDAAGNPSPAGTKTFTKDATGPTLAGLAASKVNIASNGQTTVTGTSSEVGNVTVNVTNGAVSKTMGANVPAGSFSITVDVSTLADGTLQVSATGKDAKSNVGPAATTTTTKDTVKPVVTGLAATATTGVSSTTTVSGTTEAGISVALTVTDGVKTASKTVTSAANGSFSTTFDLTGYKSGQLPVTAQATDAAGNVGDKAQTTASRDATGPTISNLAATATTGAKPASTVNGTVDDPQATVALVATDKNGKTASGSATVAGDGSFSGTLDLSGLADGTVTVTATGTDKVGNAGAPVSTTTTKDTTGPAISKLAATDVSTAKPSTTVTGTVDDAAAAVTLTATDRNGLTKTGTATVASDGSFSGSLDLSSFADGSVTVSASGTDTAGNAGPASSLTINKDITGPVVSGLAATASTFRQPNSTVTGSVDDKAATVVVEATDTAGKKVAGTATVDASSGAFTATLDLSSLADGAITVKATATDTGGNTGTATTSTTRDSTPPVGYRPLTPARLLDTRNGTGGSGTVGGGAEVALQVLGQGGVPSSGVSAVVLNVTAVSPARAGYVTVYPHGTTRPTASNLNVVAGQTVANLVVVPVGADGKVSLYNGSAGSIQLLADVEGYYTTGESTSPGAFGALSPSRLLDTRSGSGPVAGGAAVALQVLGRGGVPTGGVSAVVLNVTAVSPARAGYVTAYANGGSRPTASNLNFVAGQTVPNLVVAPVGSDGKVALYNGSTGSVQLLADVAGYFAAGTPTTSGAFGALAPARLLDTRDGTGASGPVAAGATVALQVLGRGGVPATGVSAVVLNLTAVSPTQAGFLTAYGSGGTRPTASNLNFTAGKTVPNLVVVPVGADGKVALYNGSNGTVQLLADVAGYVLS